MTDITLGQPLGGFYWRGTIPGQLCGATVTWACAYESSEPIAIPPFIDYADEHVIVTNQLPEGTDGPGIPTYVSPGTLTLTPTVTCPNDAGDPIVTVLDPITLVISDEGCSSGCTNVIPDFPLNADAEDGVMSPWIPFNTSIESDPALVRTGSYSFSFYAEGNASMRQVGMGFTFCDAPARLEVQLYAYAEFEPQSDIDVRLEFLDANEDTLLRVQVLDNLVPFGVWTLITMGHDADAALLLQTKGLRIRIATPHADVRVDDISLVIS